MPLLHDFWIYHGLPKMYYWELKKEVYGSFDVSTRNIGNKDN
jgi:hypothetical protein